MELDQSFCQRQAYPQAILHVIGRNLTLREKIEYVWKFFTADAYSVVLNRYFLFLIQFDFQLDLAADRSEFGRVMQKIAYALAEPHGIDFQQDVPVWRLKIER